ncbi:MAG: SMC family ATPase, partial [Bifidobacteriaceae bacterium]|nr:SMC family ATPase [Bifidobacteriaceae bacterium]
MRFHRLEFGGIGPFAGSHVIDFSDLTASGLFLLEGPTGAGKSTIIDALVFALYGSIGEAGAYDRLRSDYARAEDESFVDLVYEVGGGVYRIRRTPHYERPRRRGEGVTLKQSTARLWRLASPDAVAGEVVATKVEEASAEVLRDVGLSREQFTQTVVLPQGQFAAFLKADNEQRRTLLQRIFGSELYQRLAEQLRARRAAAEAALQRLGNHLRMAVAALARVADLPQETADNLSDAADAAAQEGQDSPLVELSNQVRSAVEARSGELAAASDQAGDLARRLKAEADRAQAAAEAAAAKRRLSLRLADLESDRPRRRETERRLAEARRAGPISALLDSAAAAARELDRARAEAVAVGLPEGSIDEAPCQAALEEAQSSERRAADRLTAARALAEAALAHRSAAERLDGLEAELTRAAEAQAGAARAVEREAQAGPQARTEVEIGRAH